MCRSFLLFIGLFPFQRHGVRKVAFMKYLEYRDLDEVAVDV